MEDLYSLDMIIVVFATNDLDLTTTHLYGRKHTDDEAKELAYEQVKLSHGEDAVKGFEVLSIVR